MKKRNYKVPPPKDTDVCVCGHRRSEHGQAGCESAVYSQAPGCSCWTFKFARAGTEGER